MADLTIEDEGLHAAGPEHNWQESAVVAWRDFDTDIGGNHRVAVWHNQNYSNLWCGVYHQRDKIYRLNLEHQPRIDMPAGTHGFGCGPQRLFHDGKNLRLQLDTPECTVDLIIDDIKGSTEKFDDAGGISAPTYRNHYNMHCRLHGTVVLNGVRHDVKNALGWRDHSWGPRDYTAKLGHRSFHGNFGEKLNSHLLTVLTTTGKLERRGFLVRDGVAMDINTFTTRMELLEDGVTPVRASCHVFLESKEIPGGEKLVFTCEVQKGVMSQVLQMRGFFGVGDCYHVDRNGKRERGFCNIEITNNPRFGERDLTMAIGNTLTNGFHQIDIADWMYQPLD